MLVALVKVAQVDDLQPGKGMVVQAGRRLSHCSTSEGHSTLFTTAARTWADRSAKAKSKGRL